MFNFKYPQTLCKTLSFPHLWQCLVFSFLNKNHSSKYAIVALICISLVIGDVGKVCMCLLAFVIKKCCCSLLIFCSTHFFGGGNYRFFFLHILNISLLPTILLICFHYFMGWHIIWLMFFDATLIMRWSSLSSTFAVYNFNR